MSTPEVSLLDKLVEQADYSAIETILHGTKMNEITASATLCSVVAKRIIVSLDTGLQKTSIMGALAIISRVRSKFTKLPLLVIPKEASHNIPIIEKWLKGFHLTVLDSELGVKGRLPKYQELH